MGWHSIDNKVGNLRKEIIFLSLPIFLIILISGISLYNSNNNDTAFKKFDTTKTYNAVDKEVTITNSSNPNDLMLKLKLIENTEYCSEDCYAIIKVDNKRAIPLSNEYDETFNWSFKNLKDNKSININHGFKIAYNKSIIQKPISLVCNQDENNITTGCNTTYGDFEVYDWEDFDYKNKVLNPGIFYIKLEGTKDYRDSIDWIPTFLSVTVEEWAKWTTVSSLANFTFDSSGNLGYNTGKTYALSNLSNDALVLNQSSCIDSNCTKFSSNVSILPNQTFASGSLVFWFRPDVNTSLSGDGCFAQYDGAGNNQGDFSFGYQGCNGIVATGAISLYFNTVVGTVTASTTRTEFVKDRWYFIVGKLNASGVYLYVDGVLNGSSTYSDTPGFFRASLYNAIGGNTIGGSIVNGTLDEMRFFDVELSDAQIADINNTEVPVTSTPCTAPTSGFWEWDCSQNCTYSGTANNVTLAGNANLTGAGTITFNESASLIMNRSANSVLYKASACKIVLNTTAGSKIYK